MKTFLTGSLILSAALISNTSWAADSKEKAKREYTTAQKLELKETAKEANRENNGINTDLVFHCGHTIPISFEPEIVYTWAPKNEDGVAFCSFARLGIAELCKEGSKETQEAYKKTIKEKIKEIHCYEAVQPKAIDLSLKDGILKMGLGAKMNDNSIKGAVHDFIKAKL